MAKFCVTISYNVEVEANSEEEAIDKIDDFDLGPHYVPSTFNIDDIWEQEESENAPSKETKDL